MVAPLLLGGLLTGASMFGRQQREKSDRADLAQSLNQYAQLLAPNTFSDQPQNQLSLLKERPITNLLQAAQTDPLAFKQVRDLAGLKTQEKLGLTEPGQDKYLKGSFFIDDASGISAESYTINGQRRFRIGAEDLSNEEAYRRYPGLRPETKGGFGRGFMNANTILDLSELVNKEEKGLRSLESYMQTVSKTNFGVKRFVDSLSEKIKTLSGTPIDGKNYTPEEIYRAMAEGQLQGLMGANRIDTVGGGVMTEKDAWRVIINLGGELDSLQNPIAVREALRRMYKQRASSYNNYAKKFNYQMRIQPNYMTQGGYEFKNEIDEEDINRIFGEEYQGVEYLTDEFED